MTGILDREELFRVTAIESNYRPGIVLNAENIYDRIKEWHERLGHASRSQLKYLVEQGIIKDFNLVELKNYKLGCVACEKGKMTRMSFSKRKDRNSTCIGDVIHSDVCGPITPIALGGYRYFVTFTDDYSRFTWVTLIKHKDEVFSLFKNLYNELKTQKGVKIKKLVSDGGGEYISRVFENYLLKKGIESEFTPKNTPQMNGVAERLNRTLMNIVRSMLKGNNLNSRLWGEALVYANRIINRSVKKRTMKIPFEVMFGIKPDLSMFKTFGVSVMYHNNDGHLRKLDDRSFPGVFCGINSSSTAFRVFDVKKNIMTISRDVKFFEKGEVIFKIDIPDEYLRVYGEAQVADSKHNLKRNLHCSLLNTSVNNPIRIH
jgi:transposase InsO family protein